MRKYLGLLVLTAILLAGCVKEKETEIMKVGTETGKCKEEAVAITGYGDKGKRLSNCFVEYPGEPTREDKSYYVLEDICGQFTKEFMERVLEKPVVRVEPSKINSLYNCSYYVNDSGDYVMLVLDYLKAENQKLGHEAIGRRVEVSDKIPMKNMVVWQEDGAINSIYLVLGEEKFISIQRSSTKALTNEEDLNLAAKIGETIKNYK
ncbi:MAG: hypothetical protein WC596_02050 [Candidatus Shapirobacteria bacterium]